jgi:imidazolonepropionase-like amidohydrolase
MAAARRIPTSAARAPWYRRIMRIWIPLTLVGLLHSDTARAQLADAVAQPLKKYLSVATSKVILEHVELIDGTGATPKADQNISIEGGKIVAISPGRDESPAAGTTILDLRGRTVIPGLVGMHDHLFYLALPNLRADGTFERPAMFHEMIFSAPRMYLANGVTTLRTTGGIEPDSDLKLQRDIEKGARLGPHLDVTGPYLDGDLNGPEDARRTVRYWAERGVTSFKSYKYITRDALRAAVEEAHELGLKVTGHLCSVTYPEAVALGIDNLEHGFFENTQLGPNRKPDVCSEDAGDYTLQHMTPDSVEGHRLIALLIERHVAITSTLPSAAARADPAHGVPAGALEAMAPHLREAYLYGRNRAIDSAALSSERALLKREMELERAFVAAGGLLLAGADPVGAQGVTPGFGDQREVELLVEAGFTPVQAIRIATLNGAIYLGRADRIGSIAIGKNADLVVIKGDPALRIADVENVEIVFKDGTGYDPQKLLESVKGRYGAY